MGNRAMGTMVFHDNIDTPQDGGTFSISQADSVSIEIGGTATAFKLILEVKNDGDWYAKCATDIASFSLATGGIITDKTKAWEVDTTAWSFIRLRLIEISGGTITVKGRAVY